MSAVTENTVFLNRGNYTTCTVLLHGGTILSYRVHNHEILYMKQKTNFNKVSPIRGGIKFTFPYFGRRINGPKHGFARYVPWKLEAGPTKLPDGNIEATFSLEESEYTKAIWGYKFKLSYKLTLCLNCLIIDVKVQNTSSHLPFLFNILRHSIFRVEDIREVEVYGLSKCQYFNFNRKVKNVKDPNPNEDKIIINRAFLDVYLQAPPVVEVYNIDSRGLKLRITSNNPSSTDVLLYNPWRDEDVVEEDSLHNEQEYLECIGVGNGFIHTDIRLEPKQTWESEYVIEVIDEKYDERTENLCRLLNNPWELFKDKCPTINTY